MSNPILDFERDLANFGDVERLEYRTERKLVRREMATVTSLALLFDGVGIYSLTCIDDMKAISIDTVAVHPSKQGSGIGKRMIRLLCSFSERFGYILTAKAQLLKVSGKGFTKDSYAALKGDFAEPIGDVKRDITWRQYLMDNFGFAPAGHHNEIIRFPQTREA